MTLGTNQPFSGCKTKGQLRAYRLCVGVTYFCGWRLGFEFGVEACCIFRLLLGVLGSSASL